jgi:hypothetical protein
MSSFQPEANESARQGYWAELLERVARCRSGLPAEHPINDPTSADVRTGIEAVAKYAWAVAARVLQRRR